MELDIIKGKKVAELREICAALKIEGAAKMKKAEIVALLTKMHEEAQAAAQAPAAEPAETPAEKAEEPVEASEIPEEITEASVPEESSSEELEEAPAAEPGKKPQKEGRFEKTGILDIAEGGFGFLRFNNFLTSDEDVYVSPTQIRRFNLKTGDEICGIVRRPGENERFGALLYVNTVNGDEPGVSIRRKDFSELTPIYPYERIRLETGSRVLSMRLTDLVAPIGKGQRGIIVAPPKAGKTTLLKQIAQAIEAQDLDAELMVLLIDERPEEVTDMQRSIKGTVIYSTFDEQPSHHVKVAEMVLERAERLVEHGKDVIILMDSITRLARAYNLVEQPSGRTLSGGLDPAALYKPKKFFGAARKIEEGGSITILATALVETGSRMDDMIFEEFKGTGNMELHLDRRLQEKRIFPAINLNKSGTRREDMLMSPEELEAVWLMRRAVADWGVQEATEKIVMDLAQTKSNAEFIMRFRKTRL
ncbi:MAG: transcription termination factor Rho [Firmicutes bacterium]|nr:transcription termination factor Rho [Bacillota bacterium]